MSKKEFVDALNLCAPAKIPRTEYSVTMHHALLKKVTGIDPETSERASVEANREFYKKWDFGFIWSILVHRGFLTEHKGRVSSMGHAVFKEDGSDFRNDAYCSFATPEEAIMLDPCKEYGEFDQADLIKRFEKAYRDELNSSDYPQRMTGVYISMFSGLIEIYGFEMLLLTMGMYEKEFGKVIDGYYHWVKQFFDAYAKTDIPIMMVHDDLCWTEGPVTHPEWYRKYIFPYLKKLIEPVKASGKKVIFTSDGTIDAFFDDFIDLGIDSLVMEPTSDIRGFLKRYGDRCGAVGGMDCRLITSGSFEKIENEVKDILEFGKKYPGYVFATGNHLPPNISVERCEFYHEMYEKYARR